MQSLIFIYIKFIVPVLITSIYVSQIFYFLGFGFFCLEALLSLWVIQVRTSYSSYEIFDFLVKYILITWRIKLMTWCEICGYAASIHVFPRERPSCRDEAWGWPISPVTRVCTLVFIYGDLVCYYYDWFTYGSFRLVKIFHLFAFVNLLFCSLQELVFIFSLLF